MDRCIADNRINGPRMRKLLSLRATCVRTLISCWGVWSVSVGPNRITRKSFSLMAIKSLNWGKKGQNTKRIHICLRNSYKLCRSKLCIGINRWSNSRKIIIFRGETLFQNHRSIKSFNYIKICKRKIRPYNKLMRS